jgi:RNA 2',3'-cyclic 3'-phosphodiesterase
MTQRLFFALWPDPRLRAELERRLPALAGAVDGKAQRPDQWHVTLEFLGSVADERLSAVWEAAERVAVAPFEVVFDRLDHWRRPQVYCLAARDVPVPLAQLVEQLRTGLTFLGFEPETRDYRPHVTLARKVRDARPQPLTPALQWPADRFALVRSVSDATGSRYEPLRWWNLDRRGG